MLRSLFHNDFVYLGEYCVLTYHKSKIILLGVSRLSKAVVVRSTSHNTARSVECCFLKPYGRAVQSNCKFDYI